MVLLSTEQLIELLNSVYQHLDSRIMTINPKDIILCYDKENNLFYQTTLEAIQDAIDPVKGLIDNLESHEVDYALTANQGRVLKEFHDINAEAIKKLIEEVLRLDKDKLNNVVTLDDKVKFFDSIPTKDSDKFVTSNTVRTAIDLAVVSVFKFKGNVKIVDNIVIKTDDTPVELVVGYIYNNTIAGKIFKNNVDDTTGFIDVNQYENIAWTEQGWDELGGITDMSKYATIEYVDAKIGVIGEALDVINNKVI